MRRPTNDQLCNLVLEMRDIDLYYGDDRTITMDISSMYGHEKQQLVGPFKVSGHDLNALLNVQWTDSSDTMTIQIVFLDTDDGAILDSSATPELNTKLLTIRNRWIDAQATIVNPVRT